MWEYGEAGRLMTMRSIAVEHCIYCHFKLHRMRPVEFEGEDRLYFAQLSLCLQCGWWSVYRVHQGENPRTRHMMEDYVGAIGCLKELDLADISTPLEAVRQYLLAKSDSLFTMHPKLFKDVVCSVFLDFGWKAQVTAYAGDDGVDVILEGASGSKVGVQVKRYRKDRRIEAEQIRSLAGALLIKKFTRGIFVTTSTFRRGAKRTANELASIGRPVELVDAERFLHALGVAQIKSADFSKELLLSYMKSPGVIVGSGLLKPLDPDENLLEREIAGQVFVRDEIMELVGDST